MTSYVFGSRACLQGDCRFTVTDFRRVGEVRVLFVFYFFVCMGIRSKPQMSVIATRVRNTEATY